MFKKIILFVLLMLFNIAFTCHSGNIAGQKPIKDDSLVLYYTFDKDKKNIATDLSGRGNNGNIIKANHTVSPRGNALEFNGSGSHVYCGKKKSLSISGDMTLEMWIKFDPKDLKGKYRLIFGDNGGLAVNRNYTLYTDLAGNIKFAMGNGTSKQHVLIKNNLFKKDKWHHFAIVCAYPWCFVFIDGKMLEKNRLYFPATKTNSFARNIGGWNHGFFKGFIDELRLYNRALTQKEIEDHAGKKENKKVGKKPVEVNITLSQNWLKKKAYTKIRAVNLPNGKYFADISFFLNKKVVLKRKAALKRDKVIGDLYKATTDTNLSVLLPGEYIVKTEIRNHKNKIIKALLQKFKVTQKPDWIGNKIGISGEVLPPYTPVKVIKAKNSDIFVSMWGRKYIFGSTPFVKQIISAGKNMLAGPIHISGQVNSEKITFKTKKTILKKAIATEAIVQQNFQAKNIRLSINSSIEYDGFMKFDISVIPEKTQISIKNLAIEIPLSAEFAKYRFAYNHKTNKIHSGFLASKESFPFIPNLWIGDEERGISWLAESDQYWNLNDEDKAIQIIRNKSQNTVTLRLNLINIPTSFKYGEKIKYIFALQATPLKKMEKTVWDYRIVRMEGYGQELKYPDKKVFDTPILDYYSKKGARTYILFRQEVFAYPTPITESFGDKVKKLVKASHKEKLNVIPYTISWLFSDLAPEHKDYKEQIQMMPERVFPSSQLSTIEKKQHCCYACQAGPWQDLMIKRFDELMTKYKVDGVYLDTTAVIFECMNQQHGCGYKRRDGTIRATFPVFGIRKLLKRIYTVVKKHNPDGIVDLHVFNTMNSAALAFVTSYWNGEQLSHKPFKLDALPLDRFRTEFMGRNWGVPADVLYYIMRDYNKVLSMALLHDVPVRPEHLSELAIISKIWKLREQYGCSKAKWHPYWEKNKTVRIAPKGCYTSYFSHPKNGCLILVSNLTRTNQHIKMNLNSSKLGLGKSFTAVNAIDGKAVTISSSGEINFDLPSQGWRYIWAKSKK
jgi:Concanavalin A-like lectin/glucanases superfamily/Glycoside hydrolase 123, N-terminal domain/Domain of unknown function (DUF6259)